MVPKIRENDKIIQLLHSFRKQKTQSNLPGELENSSEHLAADKFPEATYFCDWSSLPLYSAVAGKHTLVTPTLPWVIPPHFFF